MGLPDGITTPQAIFIRDADQSDASDIAQLLDQLGYPSSPGQITPRLEDVSASPADQILIVETGGELTAMASIHFMLYFHRGETQCKITSFVVKDGYRGQGIGSALLAHIEQIARRQGCRRMELTSAESRADAHTFYEGKGYSRAGFKFYRPLE